MMKYIILFTMVIFTTSFIQAQSWKDSLRLGKQYYQEGNYKQAYQSLLEAQKLAPSEVDLSQDIGNAAYRSQDYEMAEKAYRAAASNGEDNALQSKHWHNVGNSQMQAKNYKDAVESYKNALRKNPSDEKARYNLAEAKRRVQQQEKQDKEQNKDQNENQDPSDDDKQKDKQNEVQPDDEKKNNQNQKEQNQNSDPGDGSSEEPQESEGKLSDRKTDRMLEELLKKEMQTKKKVRGIESGNQQQVKSGKRW